MVIDSVYGIETNQEQWGVIDLFGHTRLAGRISEFPFGGDSFVRLEIPEVKAIPAHTRLFGKGAIYSISFTSREIAEAVARRLQAVPITEFDFDQSTRERLRALPVDRSVSASSIHDDAITPTTFDDGSDGDDEDDFDESRLNDLRL